MNMRIESFWNCGASRVRSTLLLYLVFAALAPSLMPKIPEIIDVHHVHIWSLTDERPVLTLHARITEQVDHDRIVNDIHRALESLFGVRHATVQIEYGPCTDDIERVDHH